MRPDELKDATGQWFDECRAAVSRLSHQQQQEVLNLIRRGKTVGDTMKALGVSQEAVCGVINANIESAYSIRSTIA